MIGREEIGKEVHSQSRIAPQVSEPGAQSLPNLRKTPRLYSPVPALPHLLPTLGAGRRVARRYQVKLVNLSAPGMIEEIGR